MSVGRVYVLFGEVSIQILCPFFNGENHFLDVEHCLIDYSVPIQNFENIISDHIFVATFFCLVLILSITEE